MAVNRVSAYRAERDGSIHETRKEAEQHDRELHAIEVIRQWADARDGFNAEEFSEDLIKDFAFFRRVAAILEGRETS